jgi:hypothetical protein
VPFPDERYDENVGNSTRGSVEDRDTGRAYGLCGTGTGHEGPGNGRRVASGEEAGEGRRD